MLKRRKIIGMYMTQVVCDKCGKEMRCTNILCSYPAQYCYSCDQCGTSFCTTTKSGTIEYEFEEDKDAYFNKLQNQAVARVKNKKGVTHLKKKLNIPVKICPYCQTQLEGDAMKTPYGGTHLIYECPNNCKLTFAESNIFLPKDDESVFRYEEEEIDVCTTLLP